MQLGSPTEQLLFVPKKVPTAKADPALRRFIALDRRLFRVARKVRILNSMSWEHAHKLNFLKQWKKKQPLLPKVEYGHQTFVEEKRELTQIMQGCDRSHPVGAFLYETAESYLFAAQMVENRAQPEFTELSSLIYGRPDDKVGWDNLTHLQAANHFIDSTKEIITSFCLPQDAYCLTAEYIAKKISFTLKPFFKDHPISVLIDGKLASKACATGRYIKLRARTCYSEMDIAQLINHEGFVHMLTMINGREQSNLKCLGLAAPRTTRTQEGLATFAELMTGTIDLHRLLRIALRIQATHHALEGADFIDLFRYFLENGQSQDESFESARRIFRGGRVEGRVVLTKDVVYLQGLLLTHTFFRKAVQTNKFHYAQHLFSGRMTLADAIALEPFFAYGFIRPPYYVPPWLVNRECFAAHLTYYVFANKITLADVDLKDFFNMP